MQQFCNVQAVSHLRSPEVRMNARRSFAVIAAALAITMVGTQAAEAATNPPRPPSGRSAQAPQNYSRPSSGPTGRNAQAPSSYSGNRPKSNNNNSVPKYDPNKYVKNAPSSSINVSSNTRAKGSSYTF